MTEALPEAVNRLHSIERAQERLGVGRSKVFELIASGELRSVRVGRRRLVPEQAIRDFIARLDEQAWGVAVNTFTTGDAAAKTNEADIIQPLDHAAAERLDKRIRLMVESLRENVAKIEALLVEAEAGQIHLKLGFKSWTAYLADALKGRLELNTETRRRVVEMLAGHRMSQRAIAQATGVGRTTVQRDLAAPDGQVAHNGHLKR